MAENDVDSGVANGVIYIDQEDGIKRVMNNSKLYIKLLDKFRTGTSPDELFKTLEAGDYEKAQVAVHTIKGVAANLSLQELYKQALELETQIKTRAVHNGAPEAFRTCFDVTLQCIDMVIKQHG
ncbi:MAG: Hpt domain-containing protein [Treponema sp.]|jgi:HPt (histidine-containing phosphotransfer) domain-containing protein|nr:Hpt domain-containing protein [Treponema sp.]